METIYSPYAIFRWDDGAELKHTSSSICLAWPFRGLLRKAKIILLDISSYQDKTKVLVTWNGALGKGEFARMTKSFGQEHQNVTFVYR